MVIILKTPVFSSAPWANIIKLHFELNTKGTIFFKSLVSISRNVWNKFIILLTGSIEKGLKMFRDIRYLLTFQAVLEADMWYAQGHSYMLRCAHSRSSVCAHTLWVLFRTDYCLVVHGHTKFLLVQGHRYVHPHTLRLYRRLYRL